ncbi:MAG: ABC transporter permease [Clostridiales bacterium]|nr:ABC transporter permease [Clostridiales bacterium]
MNILENLKSSIKNVFANKMRALLTMLGIIIGIGSVIMIMSIGAGSQAAMNEQFESMGMGRINVSVAGNNRDISQNDLMTIKDYNALAENEDIKYIAATYSASAEIKLLDKTKTKRASLTGIYGDYQQITSPTLLYGRYIIDNDNDLAAKVAVINDTTAVNVFGAADESVIGRKISLPTYRGVQKYTVVGVLSNANAAIERQYSDQFPESVIMPIVTLQRLYGTSQVDQITVLANDSNNADSVATALTNRLDILHRTTEKYYAQNTMAMMEQINSVTSMITGFISAVAGISLVVGGIGVMNIMLVTVTERTREIGIRKSIGARRRDIRRQFMIEAVILTGVGGAIGLTLGWGGGNAIGNLIGVAPVVTVQSVLLAVLISCGIGIVFGVYPAGKAAKLDPIEALRYE